MRIAYVFVPARLFELKGNKMNQRKDHNHPDVMQFRRMEQSELVAFIANKYDAKEDYSDAWIALVYRVGEKEAERLVDQF